MVNKTCISCKVEKPVTDFFKHGEAKDGHINQCKPCVKARQVKNGKDWKSYKKLESTDQLLKTSFIWP